jgi:hypothetical protein
MEAIFFDLMTSPYISHSIQIKTFFFKITPIFFKHIFKILYFLLPLPYQKNIINF